MWPRISATPRYARCIWSTGSSRFRTERYQVSFDSLETGQRVAGSETARIVIVAAGSMGSTELLLRARDIHRTLPKVSPTLGLHWSGNGDFLTPAFYPLRDVEASKGPTIASAIDFEDGSQGGNKFWIQDGGIPDLAIAYLLRKADDPSTGYKAKLTIDLLKRFLTRPSRCVRLCPGSPRETMPATGR